MNRRTKSLDGKLSRLMVDGAGLGHIQLLVLCADCPVGPRCSTLLATRVSRGHLHRKYNFCFF